MAQIEICSDKVLPQNKLYNLVLLTKAQGVWKSRPKHLNAYKYAWRPSGDFAHEGKAPPNFHTLVKVIDTKYSKQYGEVLRKVTFG